MNTLSLSTLKRTVAAHVNSSNIASFQFKNSTADESVLHTIVLKSHWFDSPEQYQFVKQTPEKLHVEVNDPTDAEEVKAATIKKIKQAHYHRTELNQILAANRVHPVASEVLKQLANCRKPQEVLSEFKQQTGNIVSERQLLMIPMAMVLNAASKGKYTFNLINPTAIFYQAGTEEGLLREEVELLSKNSGENSAYKLLIDKHLKFDWSDSIPNHVNQAKMILMFAEQFNHSLKAMQNRFPAENNEYPEFAFFAEDFVAPFQQIVQQYEDNKAEERQRFISDVASCHDIGQNERVQLAHKYAPDTYESVLLDEARNKLLDVVGQALGKNTHIYNRSDDEANFRYHGYSQLPEGLCSAPSIEMLSLVAQLDELRQSDALIKLLLPELEENISFPYDPNDDTCYVWINNLRTDVFRDSDVISFQI